MSSENEVLRGFGQRLRALRADESQYDFCERLGLKQPTLSAWERATREPKITDVVRIAAATGTNLNWLCLGEGRQPLDIPMTLSQPSRASLTAPRQLLADTTPFNAAVQAFIEEFKRLNEHGRTSLLSRFWIAFPELADTHQVARPRGGDHAFRSRHR